MTIIILTDTIYVRAIKGIVTGNWHDPNSSPFRCAVWVFYLDKDRRGSIYTVIKRINNNTVFVTTGLDELVVMGKGIGFQVYPGDKIGSDKIERKYILESESSENSQFLQFVETIPEDILWVVKGLIDEVEQKFSVQLHDVLLINLADHISFYLTRKKKNLILRNPLEADIKLLYPKEYSMAQFSLEYLSQQGVDISEEELSYFTMHFVNASDIYSVEMSETLMVTKVTSDIVKMLESCMEISIDYDSIAFNRFITHVRFFVIRQIRFQSCQEEVSLLYSTVEKEFPTEYSCVEYISKNLEKKYGWNISTNEKTYLTIHIIRLSTNYNELRRKEENL